jgi:hypothetical protein
MIKISFLKPVIIGALFTLLSEGAFAFSACATTGSEANRISETTDCYTQPDIQQVTFYKIAFCRTQPTAPTSLAAIDTSSCVTVFENSSGSTIQIQKNITINLVGAYTRPPNGLYTHIYVEISPAMAVRKVAYFNSSKFNTDSTSSGTKCWSLGVSMHGYNSFGPTVTSCGADGVATTGLNLSTHYANTLNGAVGYVHTAVFPTSYGENLTAYLADSSNKLVTLGTRDGMGTIAKIIGVYPQTLNITRAELISLIELKYANSTGVGINMSGGVLGNFSPGPFDIYFAIRY